MEYKIASEIYDLVNKGEANLTEPDAEKLFAMTTATEKFEDEVLGLKPSKKPESLSEVIELFMYKNLSLLRQVLLQNHTIQLVGICNPDAIIMDF